VTAFHIFVDESGGFSFRKPNSFVGGFACTEPNVSSVTKCLKTSAEEFNSRLLADFPDQAPFVNPDHLHFMPLHVASLRRGNDEGIRVSPELVPEFFRALFHRLKPLVDCAFRSTGVPGLVANDHACYVEVLRHTLLQLIDDPMWREASELKITVAHRRGLERYGSDGHYYQRDYEHHFQTYLARELRDAFVGERPRISVEIADGRHQRGLILADFFCGAMAWEQEDYLEDWKRVNQYSFSGGYRRVGPRLPQRLLDEFENVDELSATHRTVEALSADPSNKELGVLLTTMLSRLDHSQWTVFCEEARENLDEKILSSSDRYDQLEAVGEMIRILRAALPPDPEQMKACERRLHAGLLLNQVRVDSHRGFTDPKPFDACLDFLEKFGHRTFANQLELMQERIEVVLSGVQLSFFNSWRFDAVEGSVVSLLKTYSAMFQEQFAASGNLDDNLARLEGTLGQMYALIGDTPGNHCYLEEAEEHLRKDVQSCVPGSFYWHQGMGYLTVLYWKRGELEQSVKRFLAETESETEDPNLIYDLSRLDLFGSRIDPFFFLHRLNVCALAQQRGKKIQGLENAKAYALQAGRLYSYPRCQIAKWLGVMLATDGHPEAALPLLEAALKMGDGGLTLDVLRLPIQLVAHKCRRSSGKRSSLEPMKEIGALDKRQPGIKEKLADLGFVELIQHDGLENLYEVGTALPFYYS
jgi:hypothetical protein